MNKTEKIIIVIVLIAIVAAIVISTVIKNNQKFVYYYAKTGKMENEFIEDYKTFEKFCKTNGLGGMTISNQIDFSKSTIEDTFSEEFFENNKVAIVSVYEDDSKSVVYSVDKVEYLNDGKVANVYYTDKKGEYLGPLGNSWHNTMFVVLKGTVTTVNFQKNAL